MVKLLKLPIGPKSSRYSEMKIISEIMRAFRKNSFDFERFVIKNVSEKPRQSPIVSKIRSYDNSIAPNYYINNDSS